MTAVQALFKGIIKSMLGRVLKVFMNVALIPILSTVFNSQLSVGIGSSIGDHTLSSAIIAEPIVSEKDGIVIAFDIQVD